MYNYDYSTLDQEALARLPIHKKPSTYDYQRGPGNGCAGDAPGYPSYFTRSVYTQHGNSPGRGAQTVIIVPGMEPRIIEDAKWHDADKNWDAHYARYQRKLRRLWVSLPLDHIRVRMWIKSLYVHHHHCYVDDSKGPQDRDRTIIWPVPDYKLRQFKDDPRFSEDWRQKEIAAVLQENSETVNHYREFVTDKNHLAVRRIQKFYPDYKAEPDMIDDPKGEGRDPSWWERYSTQPTPEQCAGLGGSHSHPIGNPCQTCGHAVEEEEDES